MAAAEAASAGGFMPNVLAMLFGQVSVSACVRVCVRPLKHSTQNPVYVCVYVCVEGGGAGLLGAFVFFCLFCMFHTAAVLFGQDDSQDASAPGLVTKATSTS